MRKAIEFFSKYVLTFLGFQSLIFGEEWNTVNLASYPRSGNGWVRLLVEEATHIATGSVYAPKSQTYPENSFSLQRYTSDNQINDDCRYPTKNDPVLIKSHYPYYLKKIDPQPKRTICLIRHPIDSFWSLKLYFIERGQSTEFDKKISEDQLNKYINGWRNFYEYWLSQSDVLFVRYEDLLADTSSNLKLILQNVGYSFEEADIKRAVDKYPAFDKPLKHQDNYSSEQIEKIKTELADILSRFNYDI